MIEYICSFEEECGFLVSASMKYGEELIRCKDCKYWMRNPYRESSVFGLCFKHEDIAIATDETDWCSWAKRKDNG